MSEKNIFSRTLTKGPRLILRPFLESNRCQEKNVFKTLTKPLTAILGPFLENSSCQKKVFSRSLTNGPTMILRPFLVSRQFFMVVRKKMCLEA